MTDGTSEPLQSQPLAAPESASSDPSLGAADTPTPPTATSSWTSPGWPGPGWPTVQPTLTIPYQPPHRGDYYLPGVLITPSGDRAVVIVPCHRLWSLNTLMWHAPDLAVVALVVAFFWLIRRLYSNGRAHFDSRVVGHWYCRRCGYDLTPPSTDLRSRDIPATITPVCSECGTNTSRQRPRRATRVHVSILWPLVTMICVTGASIFVFDRTLEPAPSGPWITDLWPSPLLSAQLAWYTPLPLLQRRDAGRQLPDGQTVRIYELATGHRLARHDYSAGFVSWQFTEDGLCCFGVEYRSTAGCRVHAMDLREPMPRFLTFSAPSGARLMPIQEQPDSRTVLFSDLADAEGRPLPQPAQTLTKHSREVLLRLHALDTTTGTWTIRFSVPYRLAHSPAVIMPWLLMSPSRQLSKYTVIVQQNRQRLSISPGSLDLLTIEHGIARSKEITLPAGVEISSFVPNSDGTLGRVYFNRSGQHPAVFNFENGTLTHELSIGARLAHTDDGLLRLDCPAMPARFVDPLGGIVAVPMIGTNGAFPSMTNNDGWAVALSGGGYPPYWFTNTFGYRFRTSGIIALWDLEPIKAPIREKMCGPWQNAMDASSAANNPKGSE